MTQNKKQAQKEMVFLFGILIICCVLMYFVEKAALSYWVKSLCKVLLFGVVPLCYYAILKKPLSFLKLSWAKKDILRILGWGGATYGVILLAYFLLRGVIDLSVIELQLSENLKITGANFLGVAIYISLLNSFLEEFFFRGLAFFSLRELMPKGLSYFIGPLFFSFYHVSMLFSWFSVPIFVFIIICLFIAGLFFNWLNRKNKTIYCSYLVHMCANFAINTVGFMMFGYFG